VDGNNIVAFNTMGSNDESNLVVHFQNLFVVNEIYGVASPIPLHDTLMFFYFEIMITEKPWVHKIRIDHIIFFNKLSFQSQALCLEVLLLLHFQIDDLERSMV
jgi:hypothetical protein